MPKGNNELKKLLADKVGRVTISKSDNNTQDKKEITPFMLDTISDEEQITGPISITTLCEEKGCIYDYLNLGSLSSCDYLDIYIRIESAEQIATLYLIEQSDIDKTFKNQMQYPKNHILGSRDEDKKFKKTRIKGVAHSDDKHLQVVDKIKTSLVKENKRKFYSAVCAMILLQMDKDLSEHFPKKQVYHFVLLDVPGNIEIPIGSTNFKRRLRKDYQIKLIEYIEQGEIIKEHLKKNLANYKNDLIASISNAIETIDEVIDGPAKIIIGETIDGFNALINHIDQQKRQTN